jgi:hypothetical protein
MFSIDVVNNEVESKSSAIPIEDAKEINVLLPGRKTVSIVVRTINSAGDIAFNLLIAHDRTRTSGLTPI